jgi:putative transposase
LSVNRMTHNHCLAKSIHDAAWSQFTDLIAYKAAWAGRRYVAVNPAYTSQDCSSCGHRQPLSLADLANRTYTCPCCESEHFETGTTVSGFGLEAPAIKRESCHDEL